MPKKNGYVAQRFASALTVSRIVTIHYFEFDRRFRSASESHDFWEMVYVDKGRITARSGDKSTVLRLGDCLFHRPGEEHALSADDVVAPNVFIISFVCRSRNMAFFEGRLLHLPPALRQYIARIIAEGERAYILPFNDPNLKCLTPNPASPFGAQQFIRTSLEQLLIELTRTAEAPRETVRPAGESGPAGEVRRLLEAHIYDPLPVGEVCRRLNYSRAYLSRVFFACTGQTMGQYALRLRTDEAKRLLRESDAPLGEISDRLGFANPHAFSRSFARVTGMSPSEYRRSIYI